MENGNDHWLSAICYDCGSTDNFLIQLLNGFVSEMLLFIMASRHSLIFGLMDIIILTPGAFCLLGGYIGLSMVRGLNNFWLAMILAPLLVGACSLASRLVGRASLADRIDSPAFRK